jgi:hypothetical protein
MSSSFFSEKELMPPTSKLIHNGGIHGISAKDCTNCCREFTFGPNVTLVFLT